MSSKLEKHKLLDTPPNSYTATRHAGQLTLEWESLTATVGISKKSGKWKPPLCCLNKRVKEEKTILENISGTAIPGELSFLMGPSGSGKTTLLNCLYGFSIYANLTCKGSIKVEGSSTMDSMAKVSCYVEQDPMLLSCLTVWEHLWFQTTLRSPHIIGKQDVNDKICIVLRKVGLLHTQSTLIGVSGAGISGGERKRLSLATELISDPLVLFADECTSGLDSTTALSIATLLKSVARDGKTIIVSIHQPSSSIFALCDRLTLLSAGQTAYHGPASDILPFLEKIGHPCPIHFNVADHLMDLVSGDEVTSVVEGFGRQSDTYGYQNESKMSKSKTPSERTIEDSAAKDCTDRASFLTQLRTVFWRSWLINTRHISLARIRVAQTLIVSIFLSMIFFQTPLTAETSINKIGVLCLAIINHSVIVGLTVMRAFVHDKGIYLHEKQNNMYSIGVLYLSQVLMELPFTVAHAVVYTSIIYWAVGFQTDARKYLLTTAAVTLSDICSVSYGMMVAAYAKDFPRASAINFMIFPILILFGGPFFNPTTLPTFLKLFRWFSWVAPAAEIGAVNEFKDYEFKDYDSNGGIAASNGFANGNDVLEFYGFYSGSDYLQGRFLWLFSLIAFYNVAAFLILWLKTRGSNTIKVETRDN